MQIVMLRRSGQRAGAYNLGHPFAMAALLLGLVATLFGTLYAGYMLGEASTRPQRDELATKFETELSRQRSLVNENIRNAREHMNALALRLGQMQAQVLRLDALGERLTEIAKLDKGEFNFDSAPAIGGPPGEDSQRNLTVPDFVQELDELSQQLQDRELQLSVLEMLLMNRSLQAEVFPAGRPIMKGWTSSYFGMRTDPFTGYLDHHDGIDLAGKEGSPIIAVASGVVTWSSKRYGFGIMVEVNHGNGYVTRYAHNKRNIVDVGQTVKKGQQIAVMGSTGRSTGPHVHFEVLKNGRPVDPMPYIRVAR